MALMKKTDIAGLHQEYGLDDEDWHCRPVLKLQENHIFEIKITD